MENSLLFIFSLILGCGLFAFLIYKITIFCKNDRVNILDKKERNTFLYLILLQGILTIASSYGCVLWGKWELNSLQHVCLIFGSYIFGSGFSFLVTTFALTYYKTNLDEKMHHYIKVAMGISAFIVIASFLLMVEPISFFLDYPLPNGLSFTKGLISVKDGHVEGLTIPFYGVCIVGGAIIAYLLADHEFYKKYKKHGMLDTMFLIAFPMGLIGARLWYCLVLEPDFYLSNPDKIIAVWDGGLAIQGGAILGILSGVIFFMCFRRFVNIRWAMDMIIPTILIAQAIGRWGNFFNCEVHGNEIAVLSILPNFIVQQLQFSSDSGLGTALTVIGDNGKMFLPLFLIEGLFNVLGYFIITRLFGRKLRKYLSLGDQAMMYIIWYGIARALLEPLRYGSFEYSQSWFTSFVFIGVGLLGIIAMHSYDYFRKVKGLSPRTYDTV